MRETVPSCPLCGESQSRLFDQRRFREKPVTNQICSTCGLVYQSPRMPDDELAAFYEREYRQLYQGSQGPNEKDLSVQNRRADALLSFAASHIKNISRHLDIGCSAGLMLKRFQSAYNCSSTGVEPGNAYRSYAQKQGLNVVATLEDIHTSDEPHFDLISMAHVLEHIADPVDYLTSLRVNLLNKDGWLLIEVPNLYAHDSFEVAHLVSYSAQTLSQVLQKSGFEIHSLRKHGRPRSITLPLYITTLAQPAADAFPYHPQAESGVRIKRQLGMVRRRTLTRIFPRQSWLPLEHPDA